MLSAVGAEHVAIGDGWLDLVVTASTRMELAGISGWNFSVTNTGTELAKFRMEPICIRGY